jgi:hypothetical protein
VDLDLDLEADLAFYLLDVEAFLLEALDLDDLFLDVEVFVGTAISSISSSSSSTGKSISSSG